jgi:hypothetical protein
VLVEIGAPVLKTLARQSHGQTTMTLLANITPKLMLLLSRKFCSPSVRAVAVQMGQSRRFRDVGRESALPPTTDIVS